MSRKEVFAELTESLLRSYGEQGALNCPQGVNLPSRTAVVDILHQAEALCFPGYHVDEALDDANLAFFTGSKVVRLFDLLSEQIGKDFLYSEAHREDREQQERSACGTVLLSVDEKKYARIRAESLATLMLEELPDIRRTTVKDIQALLDGDPAAQSPDEILLAYPGLRATLVYRIANFLWNEGSLLVARMLLEYIHSRTGIDIHPGATIGEHFCIDHGTGIVIGETCIIGDHVKVYQGVTLGALSVARSLAGEKRHPTIGDHVTIYAGATILGGKTEVGEHSIIGGNTWLVKSVPPHTIVESAPLTRERMKSARRNDPWAWEI
ncbi:MAG: serine acetyltransferase [Deltaproteobacteria bacterium]|nr:serine acetyltransferase [Deltaproteobacteria bacterium]